MLNLAQRMQPRNADIASKVMDGEAIIINLANGTYYSLDKAGGFVWEQIAETRTVGETVAGISARYDVRPEQALADLERLLAELLAEGLIAPFEGEASPAPPPVVAATRLAYEPPTLNVYRDMGDLLALDPPTPGLDSPWQDPQPARS